ncbi:MAG: histidine kinase [Spirochaetota bacterium]
MIAQESAPAAGRQTTRLGRRIRDLPVGSKLMLIYVFGIFVPLVVANGLVLRSVFRDAREQQAAYLSSTIENIENAIKREFEPIELVSEFVFADTSIYRILNRDFEEFEQYVEAHRTYLVPALTKYANVFAGISRISIYTENPVLRVSAGYLRLDEQVRSSEWYRRFAQKGQRTAAFVHVDRDPRTELVPTAYLSLFRDLDRTPMQPKGDLILRIDVNPAVIQRHLSSSPVSGTIEIVDSGGNVVASEKTPVPETERYLFGDRFEGHGTLDGWTIRGLIAPIAGPPSWSSRWTLLFVVSGLSIALSSLFVLLLSRSVTSRLGRLQRQMRQVEHEDFSPIDLSDHYDDEVGALIRDYNIMARKIESLINDRYKALIENQQLLVARQQAELDALQSQVNPHFLFNVLESVRMKSHIRGESETAQVVKKISRSIRRLTSWHDDLVPLCEEVEFMREYIDIQRYRFGERLRAEIEVDPRAADALIPKLTIQGLVENACVHGIESKPEGGTVRVQVSIAGDSELRIVIADDGVGSDADELNRLASRPATGPRHIGIANINQRLRLHYGDRSSLCFASSPGYGTRAEIRIEGIHASAERCND